MDAAVLLPRKWLTTEESDAVHADFSVVQFNVLADGLSGMDPAGGGFTRVARDVLRWEYRRPLLEQELERCGADVVALHELDHFHDWAEPFMAARGFRGVFRAKPDPPLPSAGGLADGTAVFYRTAAFSLLAERSVNFTDQAGTRFNQVAVLLTLRHEAAGGELVVAGTHLKAKAAGAAARSEQVKQLAAMVREQAGERAVVVCGDMNEEPGRTVYQELTGGSLRLQSAYAWPSGEEPPLTTWKWRGDSEAKRVIDYIFFSPHRLRPVALLALPAERDVGTDGLPSPHYPSDHLALAARFQWRGAADRA